MSIFRFSTSIRSPPRRPTVFGGELSPFCTSPSQLQETFDTSINCNMPFTMGVRSPGKTSPLRGRTVKEYEEQLNLLSHENFSLKLRIYFLEERMAHTNNRSEQDEDLSKAIELKVETEMLRKDLETKQNLLCEASKALDLMEDKYKNKINDMTKVYDEEIEQLKLRITTLTKELEEAKDFNNPDLFANAFGLAMNKKCEDHHSHEEVEQLKYEIDQLQHEVERLDKVGKEQTARAKHFEVEAAEEHIECEKSTAKTVALEAELRERDARLADLAQDLEQRVHDLSESNRRVRELEDALSAKEPEIQIKVQELCARDRLIEEKQSQIDQQNKVLVEIQITLDEKKREIEALRQSLSSRDASIAELESRLSKAKSTTRALETKLDSANRENQRLLSEIASLKAHQRLMNSQQTPLDVLTTRNRRNSNSSDDGASSAHRIRQLERLLKESDEKYVILEKCKIEQEASMKKLEADHNKGLHAIQAFLKRVKELNKALDALKIEVKMKDRQLSEVTCELHELRDANNKAEWEKRQREAEIRGVPIPGAFSDVRDMADEENEGLWAELENKNKRLSQLLADKDAITSQLEKLKSNLKEKAKLLEESERKLQTQEKIIAELHQRNSINKLDILPNSNQENYVSPEKEKLRRESDSSLQQVTLVPVPQTVINQQFVALPQELNDATLRDQLLNSTQERIMLSMKVEELRDRLRNTPERDCIPSLSEYNQVKEELDRANTQRQEALQACGILIKRLEELSRFLQSLLRNRERLFLDKRRRDLIMNALDKSMELSRRLTLSFSQEPDGSLSHFDSLSGLLHSVNETEMSLLDFIEPNNSNATGTTDLDIKAQVQMIAQNLNLPEAEISSQTTNLMSQIENQETTVHEPQLSESLAAIEPADLYKDGIFFIPGQASQSESEAWSEPDRNVSLARIGLPEDNPSVSKQRNVSRNLIIDQSSGSSEDTAHEIQRTPGKRIRIDANEVRRLQNRVRTLEQLNETLHNELNIFQQFSSQTSKPISDAEFIDTNPNFNIMEDKATCTSLTLTTTASQPTECKESVMVSAHILEEIRYQREKLESFLTHNDSIRRHLEDVCRSIKEGDTAANLLAKIKETTEQLEELQNKNQQLEDKLIKTTTELEQCRENEQKMNLKAQELEETKTKVVSLQKQISELEFKMKEKDKEMIEQQCRLLELENSKRAQSKEAEEQIQKIREDLQTLETRLQLTQQENESLVTQQTQLRAEIAERVIQVERLVLESAQQKEEAFNKIEESEQRLRTIEQELTNKEKELETREWQSRADAEKKIKEAERLGRQFQEGITRQEKEKEAQNIALNSIKVHNEKLEKDVRRLEEEASRSASQMAIEKSKLLNEKLRLDQQVRQLTGKISSLTHEKQQAESEHVLANVKLEKQILDLEHQKSDLQAQVTELEAINSQLENQIAQLRFRDHQTSFGGLSPPRRGLRLSPPSSPTSGQRNMNPFNQLSNRRSPLTIPTTGSIYMSAPRSPSQQSHLSSQSGYQSQRSPTSPTPSLWTNTHQHTTLGDCPSESIQGSHQHHHSSGSIRSNRLVRQRSEISDYLSDQQTDEYEAVITQTSSYWVTTLSSNAADMIPRGNNSSPDLGIESDQGRFSSLEAPRSSLLVPPEQLEVPSMQGDQGCLTQDQTVQDNQDLLDPSLIGRLERENEDLKRKLQRTRKTLEETLSQLQSANQRKRLIDKAITKQLHKTQDVLKITKGGLPSTSE